MAASKASAVGRWRDRTILAVCSVIVLASLVFGADENAVWLFGWELPYRCVSREVLGLSCPGCGLTRAFVLTAHGSPILATEVHPLGAIGWLAVAVQIPWRVWRLAKS